MLGKFKEDWGFFFPLLAHVGVHAGITLWVCMFVNPELWWLCLVDGVVHFTMDRIKAGPRYLGRFKPLSSAEYRKATQNRWAKESHRDELRNNTFFWWSLGLDQAVHHLTDLWIVYKLVGF